MVAKDTQPHAVAIADMLLAALAMVGVPLMAVAPLLMVGCVQVTVAQGHALPKLVDLDRQLAVTTSLDEDSKEKL